MASFDELFQEASVFKKAGGYGADSKAIEFLIHSNFIEDERSAEAIKGALTAWHYALLFDEMECANILEIHRILMQRLNPLIAGQFREVGVMVGGRVCPSPMSVPHRMRQFLSDFNFAHPCTEDAARASHVKFEKIHPFRDGNGRVGRILYNWQRVKSGLPIHVIHEGAEQLEYYGWFK